MISTCLKYEILCGVQNDLAWHLRGFAIACSEASQPLETVGFFAGRGMIFTNLAAIIFW
jgi:hypothetical protein